jgi:hypothetical protein
MFYSVASPDWKPGQPLTPSGALLFRTRSEAESFAPEASAVAVAVRFDARQSMVRPQGPVALATAGDWSAPAVGNMLGGLTVFGAIPANLVRPSVEVEALARWRPESEDESHRTARAGFGGWDSLTMALLA